MSNAKNNGEKMKVEHRYANIKFEKLIEQIVVIMISVFSNSSNNSIKKIDRNSILKFLFDSRYPSKINEPKRLIDEDDIIICMENLIDKNEDYTPIIHTFFKEDTPKEHTVEDVEKSIENNPDINSVEEENSFNTQIDDLYYNEYAASYPYEIFASEDYDELIDDKDGESALSDHEIIYMLTYTSLLYNHDQLQIEGKEYIEIEDSKLEAFIEKNKKIILIGPPNSGKTTYLKHLAQKSPLTTFYCNTEEITDKFVLCAVRPDYKFWVDNYDKIKKQGCFYNPIDYYGANYTRMLQEAVPEDFTLIIDNINNPDMIRKYNKLLPCKAIFITDKVDNVDNIPVYRFGNTDMYAQLLRGFCNNIVDDKNAKKLCSYLGTNLDIYRYLKPYCKELDKYEEGRASAFFKDIVSTVYLEDLNKIIDGNKDSKGHEITVSLQYANSESSEKCLRDSIRYIYKDYLSRSEQILLHLLCRCQNNSDGLPVKKTSLYLQLEEDYPRLTDTFKHLNWLNNDVLRIPLLTATMEHKSRKTTGFSNLEYTVYLQTLRHISNIISGFTTIPIDREFCFLLIQSIHEDLVSYMKVSSRTSEKKVNKEFYDKIQVMSSEDLTFFRTNGYLWENQDDPFTNDIFQYWFIIKDFYCSSILFCLQYNYTEYAKKLHTFAINRNNLYNLSKKQKTKKEKAGAKNEELIWNLVMTICSPEENVFRSILTSSVLEDYVTRPSIEGRYSMLPDNKFPLVCFHLRSFYEIQQEAFSLWKYAQSTKYDIFLNTSYCKNSSIELASSILSLSVFKIKCPWPTKEKDNPETGQMLDYFYFILRDCLYLLINQSSISRDSWDIAFMKNHKGENSRFIYILYLSSKIYNAIFWKKDTSIVPDMQKAILNYTHKGDYNTLPLTLAKIVDYALDFKIDTQ